MNIENYRNFEHRNLKDIYQSKLKGLFEIDNSRKLKHRFLKGKLNTFLKEHLTNENFGDLCSCESAGTLGNCESGGTRGAQLGEPLRANDVAPPSVIE